MFKTGLKIVVAILGSILLFGCGNDKKSSNRIGTSTHCLYNSYTGGCDNSMYNNYSQYGFQAYPYYGAPGYSSNPNSPFRYQIDQYYGFGWGTSSQLCSCPQGTRPVYNGGLGLGCANASALPNFLPIYYHGTQSIGGPGLNNHYVNIPQQSNMTGAYYNYGGCYGNVAWSCMVNQANQCPSGTACRATAQNSPIGVCVRQ